MVSKGGSSDCLVVCAASFVRVSGQGQGNATCVGTDMVSRFAHEPDFSCFFTEEQVTLRSFIAEKDERGAEMEDFSPVVHQNAMRKSQQDDVFKVLE